MLYLEELKTTNFPIFQLESRGFEIGEDMAKLEMGEILMPLCTLKRYTRLGYVQLIDLLNVSLY